ncbi:DUF4234 domain-containing protein [candidate division WOR-3 bacterium]|nr:DUF4234 domain-containing protein [candidate division WOR-3 bacterium]
MELERNIRSFGKVIGLSIITLGIYFWVYLFKTLIEMESAFTFTYQEIAPKKVRVLLIVYLVITGTLAIIGFGVGLKNSLETLYYSDALSDFYTWKIISNFISMLVTVAFWVPFVKLIEVCQTKRKITPLDKGIMWILLTVIVVLPFASIVGTKALMLLNLPVSLIFLYMIVKQVNRIWKSA